MKLALTTALALAAPALAVPPEDFGFPSAPNDTVLSAGFAQTNGTYQSLSPGMLFGINVPAQEPVLGLQTSVYQSLANWTGDYVVCMVDPDASYPQTPTSRFILHWLQANVTVSNATLSTTNLGLLPGSRELMNTSAPVVPYRQPSPPTNSSAHRYILYAFEQPSNFSIPAAYAGYSNANRTRFNLTNFIRDTHLGTPAAANYMYVTNQTGVPANFVAAAGASYPSGNGQAVTSGDPGASAIATATSSSASGASGTSSTSSTAGAAMITGMSGLVGAGLMGLAVLL
jgi:hypothetical protein